MEKPKSVIEPGLINNQKEFQGEFFRKFTLRHARNPLQLTSEITKNYYFPTLYGDVTTAVALFLCSYKDAVKLIPDPTLDPIHIGLGRSVVAISSYRYNKVLGIQPYNEIAISIPVVKKPVFNLPIFPLLFESYPGFGFYVVSMPVTTQENLIRGHKLWGLPKVLQEIDLYMNGDRYVSTVKDEAGRSYLEFQVPMSGKRKFLGQTARLYSVLDGKTVRAVSQGEGDYLVNQYPGALIGRKPFADQSFLKLGDSPSAAFLKSLRIEPHPFQVRFSKNVSSVFDLPDAK